MKIRFVPAQRGSVLLVTLMTGAIIGIGLASYLWMVSHQNLSTMRSLAWNTAIPVAESGAEEALTQLRYTGIVNLTANGWLDMNNGWFFKQHFVGSNNFYEVLIKKVDPPIIISTAYVPAPMTPSSAYGMILNTVSASPGPVYVKRRIQVNTLRNPIFNGAMVAQGQIDFSGNNITTDGFDSGDPNYSTNGKYDSTKSKASGDVGTNSRMANALNVGNGDIKGKASTGPTGTIYLGSGGSVGDLAWVNGGTSGVEPGWSSDDMHMEIFDVAQPFTNNYSTPIGGILGLTTYDYILAGDVSGGTQNYKLSSFSGKVVVTGDVTLWVTDSVNFGSNDYILLAPGAKLKLYVSAPTATFGGSGILNSDGLAGNFAYYGMPANTTVNFKANNSFVGTLYAPQAAFILGGGGSNDYDFVGACVVNTIKMNGHYHFHFDEALRRGLWKGYVAVSWNELDPSAPIN